MLWQPTRGILQPNQHWRRGQGSVATTTWNSSDKAANITLSNGNLTATLTTGSGSNGVRALTATSAGKLYCEITITAKGSASGEQCAIGVSAASHGLTSYLGQNAQGVGFWPRSTSVCNVYFNNVGTSLGVFTNGGAVGTVWAMAVNFGLSPIKLWWKDITHASGWNNGVIGSQDPASDLGGYSPATLSGSPYFLTGELDTNATDAITLNAGATAYTGTPPSGYGNWP